MASTIPLSKTIEIATRYNYNSPLLYVNSGALAFSLADEVRQFLLSPPFAWRWNRVELSPITCAAGETDYVVSIPDFGWLERAWLQYPPASGNSQCKELTISNSLAIETVQGQPAFISVVEDDNNGNITFRLMMVPDQSYVLQLFYQKASLVFNNTTDTWNPIPDYMSYLYNKGFLAKAYEYKGDERFAFTWQEFMKLTLSANEGISETQKNIFLESKINTAREQGVIQTSQQARQSRGGA